MPNNAYQRSTKRERALVNRYRASGWISARSAGSKSEVDVWAVNKKTGEVHLNQIKTEKGGRTETKKVMWKVGDTTFYWITYT